ncbi:TolC family protein [candidate division KSB1 bacterium]|nr:TolC family protein [candidate division KSB1 bacterium]
MKYLKLLIIMIMCIIYAEFAQAQNALSLKDCIQIAIKNNSQLKNAERNVSIANSGVTSSYSHILPQVSLNASLSKTHQGEVVYLGDVPVEYDITTRWSPVFLQPDETSNIIGYSPEVQVGRPIRYEQHTVTQPTYDRRFNRFGVEVQQTIFDGGNWWNQIRKAKADERSAEHQEDAKRQNVILNVKIYYYNLLKQIGLLKVQEKSYSSAEEQYKRTESMYEIGSVAQADVYKAKVTLGAAQSDLIAQQNVVAIARYNLNYIMGQDPKTPIEIIEQEGEVVPQAYESASVEQAYETNPDLLAQEEYVSSAEYNHKISKASFWPQIGAWMQYSRFSDELKRVYSEYDKNYSWSAGISLNYNIFNGFADKARKDIQKLNYLNQQENYLEQKRILKAQIEENRLKLKANQELIKINQENLISAEEDLRLAQERYRVGSGTLLEVIQAQVSVTQAQTNVVSARYNTLISQAELEAALGILKQ